MKAFTLIVILIVLGAGALLAGSAAGPIVFEEIAERSGLTFVIRQLPDPQQESTRNHGGRRGAVRLR